MLNEKNASMFDEVMNVAMAFLVHVYVHTELYVLQVLKLVKAKQENNIIYRKCTAS